MRILLLIAMISAVFLHFPFMPSYGHGVGAETLPPVMIGNRNATLAIGVSQASTDPTNTDREIAIRLFETNSKEPVNEVTFLVKAMKNNKTLFEHEFQSDKGSLVMIVIKTESGEVQIQDGGTLKEIFESLFGSNNDSIFLIRGPIFDSAGLYQFHIEVLTADSYANKLDPPIGYDAAISIPETTSYQISDPNYGAQKIGIITYYDQIENFQYSSDTKAITFAMPFDWLENNIKQVSVVHEEIRIPKTFGELMVPTYSGFVNDLKIPDAAITVDDYSADERIVHLVLYQSELLDLTKARKDTEQIMKFKLEPSKEPKFPITAFTINAQYKVDLGWDPPKIISGTNTKFYFKVLDPYLINKTVTSVSYDFSVIQNQKIIFKKSGITIDSQTEDNIIDVPIPTDSVGPIVIAFENLNGNSFAGVEFTSVITKPPTNPVFPIRLSSFSTQNDLKIPGKYEVDLTWFPTTIAIDEQTEFVFTIKDKNTGNVVSQSFYDFVILQNGEEIFRKSGTAPAGGDYIDYTFSNGQEGSTTLRIENINNSGETVEIPFVVTPEFPSGLLLVITLGFLSTMIFSRLK